MSLRMLDLLTEGNEEKSGEAEEVPLKAIKVRIKFWDGVLLAIQDNKKKSA